MEPTSKKWFEQEEDDLEFRILASPYDNIIVGRCVSNGMTLKTAQSFDAFINLRVNPGYSNDSVRPRVDTRYYHVPIEEHENWGYTPFYITKKILDYEFAKKSKIYLHCESGVNRSPAIAISWLISRGHSLDESSAILNEIDEPMKWINIKKYLTNVFDGNIPPRLCEMYELMGKGKKLPEILDILGAEK